MDGMEKAETVLLCLLLTVLISLACLQIILRSFFSSGLVWADPLLRYLVLWSGFMGAALATSRGSHIGLDLAVYLIPEKFQPVVKVTIDLFCAITSAMLAWASLLFIRNEMEFGGEALFNIPGWCWNLIFPMTFLVICCRYCDRFITDAGQLLSIFSAKD